MAPLAAALISAAFALTLGAQYAARRRPYLLAWCVALSVYALATLTEVPGAGGNWSPVLFRVWYFLSAILLVGILALGTLYLLAPRIAPAALAGLVAVGGLGIVAMLGAELDTSLLSRPVPLGALPFGRTVFNSLAILLALVTNLGGTAVVVGGALWSAYGLWRRGQPGMRVVANVLIAAGALVVAVATGQARLGQYGLFYGGQVIGVLLMFLGFLSAQQVRLLSRVSRSTA